ncbi:MAG: Transcriptional regulator MntR [Firmicutes bacterium ADurb.Bin456]|nr:MAG: Transcriptional regulator MntR [Firmicutes bacterium ADurb.Bin456]
MVSNNFKFYTVRGYDLLSQDDTITSSMEDYLEMAYRLSRDKGFTRMGDLAGALNVQPSSASKMVRRLAEMGYLKYERYGVIQFTPRGRELGNYLLQRHEIIEEFLMLIGVKEGILEETEKIEHNIREETVIRIKSLVEFIRVDQKRLENFYTYLENRLKQPV